MAAKVFFFLALFAAAAYAQADMMEAATDKADSEGLVSAMLRAKWNKTKFDTMDAVTDAQDLDSASEEFLIASLVKKLALMKNKTKKSGDAESADDEANQYFLRRLNKTALATSWNKTALWGANDGANDRGVCNGDVACCVICCAVQFWSCAECCA